MDGEREGYILLSRLDSEQGSTGVVKSLRPYKLHPVDSLLLTFTQHTSIQTEIKQARNVLQ